MKLSENYKCCGLKKKEKKYSLDAIENAINNFIVKEVNALLLKTFGSPQ